MEASKKPNLNIKDTTTSVINSIQKFFSQIPVTDTENVFSLISPIDTVTKTLDNNNNTEHEAG